MEIQNRKYLERSSKQKQLEIYKETEYEHGKIEHEAAIELAAKLHWGLRTEVTIEEYEEEERRQTLENEIEVIERKAEEGEREKKESAETQIIIAEKLANLIEEEEDIALEMEKQESIENWLGTNYEQAASNEEQPEEGNEEEKGIAAEIETRKTLKTG